MKRKLTFFFSLVVLCLMAVPVLQAQRTYDLRGDSVRVYWNGQWQSINEDGSYPFYVASTGGTTTGGTTTGGGSTTGGTTAEGEGQVAFVINFSRGVITMDTTVLTGTSFFMSGMDEAVVINEEQSLRFPKQERGQVDGGGTYILYAYVLCNVHLMTAGDDPATDMETIYACDYFKAPNGQYYYESGVVALYDETGAVRNVDLVIVNSTNSYDTMQTPVSALPYTVSSCQSYSSLSGENCETYTFNNEAVLDQYTITISETVGGAVCSRQTKHIYLESSAPTTEIEVVYGCETFVAPDGQVFFPNQQGIITYTDESGDTVKRKLVFAHASALPETQVLYPTTELPYYFDYVENDNEYSVAIYRDTVITKKEITVNSDGTATCLLQKIMLIGDSGSVSDVETIYACDQFAIGGSVFTESGRIHFVDASGETHMADLVILPSITATNTEELQAPENPFHYTYVAGVSDTRSYDNSLTITSDTIIARYDIYFDSSEIGASCYAQPIRITMPSSEPDSVENDYAFGCGGYTAPDGQYYTQSGIITYAYDGEIYSLNLQILPVNMLSDIVEEQVSAYPYTYYDEGLNSNVVVPADTVLMRYTFDYGEDDDYPTSCTGQYVKYHLVGGDQPQTECENKTFDTVISGCNSVYYNNRYYQRSDYISDTVRHTADNCFDIYNVQITVNPSSQGYDTIVSYGPYVDTVNGSTMVYSQTTNIRRRGTNVYGCDSTTSVHIIVNPDTTQQQPACVDDTIPGGTQYETVPFTYQDDAGTYTFTSDTTFTIESIDAHIDDQCSTHMFITYVVYTDTTQQQPSTDTTLVVKEECDSFYWDVTGMAYTTSGRYEGRTATSNGVFILDLTINNSKSETIDTTVESGYVFYSRNYSDGVVIVNDTTLYEQGQTDKGCQLFRIWNFTAREQQPTCADDTIPDTQLERVPFTYQTATGASVVISQDTTFTVETVIPHENDRCFTHKIVTYVVYTDTTQQPTIDTTLVVKEECDSFYWDVTGMAYTTSGRYEGRTATSNGVFILDLTINNSKSETIDTTVQSGYVFYSRNYSDGVVIVNDTILYEQGQTDKGCQLFRIWNFTAREQQPTCVDDTITDTQLEQVPFTYQTATGASVVISQDTTFSVETVVPHDNDRCLTHKIVTYVVYTDTTQQQPACVDDTVRTDQYEVAPFTYQTNTGATRVITRDTVFTVEKRMPHENDQCYTYTMVTVSVNVDTTNISQCSNDTMVRVIDEFAPYAYGGMMLYEDTSFMSIAPHTADRCTTFVVTNIHLMPACHDVVSTMADSACGSYTWRGRTIQRTGRYVDTVHGVVNNSCDSIYIISLAVVAQQVYTEEYFGYGSYAFDMDNGTTANITADTMFRIVTTNPDGCTKVRSITIHITPVANTDTTATVEPTIDTVSACVAYTWHGRTYRQSGVYTDSNTNDVLMLTIGQRSFTQFTEQADGSYNYAGRTYTASTQIFDTLTNMDGCDSIVIINLRVRTSVEVNVTACDEYKWINGDGRVYTTSGTYFDSASMTRLNLRIRHSSTAPMQYITNCGNFTWNGLTYYRSGIYRLNIPNANVDGCDSLDIINLTIRNTGYTYTRRVECNNYGWHGVTFTTSGVYTYIDSSSACQSVEVLYLTIRNCASAGARDASDEPVRGRKSTIDTTVCDYFVWDLDGETYTHSGLYTVAGQTLNLTVKQSSFASFDTVVYNDTPITWNSMNLDRDSLAIAMLTAANGCDSIAMLYLKTVPRIIQNESACDSYTWSRNGETYTSDVTVEDFPVTLNLSIKHSSASTYRCEACENYLWENGVTYVASTTTPSRVIENAEGCDSVITLNLTLNHATSGIDQRTESGSYTWINGETYTANAVAQYTIEEGNNAGCDSLVVLALTIVEAGTEGISEVESLPVTIYPNPAVERITIAGVKVLRAELYNVAGTPVRKVENATSVNIGGLPSGIYMLRIFTPDGTAVRRVIKR